MSQSEQTPNPDTQINLTEQSLTDDARAAMRPEPAQEQLLIDMARIQREAFEAGIRRRADRLRKMAADLDGIAAHVESVPTPGTRSYATLAGSVQHTVLWGLANLSLDGLTSGAYDADRAAAELSAARPSGGA